jgi:PAS domain S-box-containing protein
MQDNYACRHNLALGISGASPRVSEHRQQKGPHWGERNVTADRWMFLVEVIERLSTVASLEEIVAIVRGSARKLAEADGIAFVRREGDECHYVEEDAVAPLWKGRHFPMSACISGWSMLHRRTVVIPDIYADPRIPHDTYRPTFVKSLIMVPIEVEQPVAAIGCYWARPRSIDPTTVPLIEALARSAAGALASVLLQSSLRESEERLRAAHQAGQLGSWEFDWLSGRLTTSPLFKASFGRGADEPLTYAELIEAIHPEDRPGQEAAVAAALATGTPLDVEYRTVWPDGNIHWIEMRGRIVPDAGGRSTRIAGVSLDVTDRRQREARIEALMREVNHRSKNLLAIAQAIAAQTARAHLASEEFVPVFSARLGALARSLDLLVQEEWRGVPLGRLVEAQLAHYAELFGSRIRLEGPQVFLTPPVAQHLAITLHELSTNAAKYGALSVPEGRVDLTWTLDGDEAEARFGMRWVETGGPAASQPDATGFGSQVIDAMATAVLGGRVMIDFAPSGFSWRLETHASRVLERAQPRSGVAAA